MVEVVSTHCCALKEINNLSHVVGAENAFKQVVTPLMTHFGYMPPFVLFSGVTKRNKIDHASGRTDDYGQGFADYLTKNDLGSVIATADGRNPATTNSVKVWIWQPDYAQVSRLYSKLTGVNSGG